MIIQGFERVRRGQLRVPRRRVVVGLHEGVGERRRVEEEVERSFRRKNRQK